MKDYFLVAYDISDPKRLQKVYKKLKGFGAHLQLSIFECHLTPREIVLMRDALEKLIKHDEDRLLIIRCCPSCKENIECIGTQKRGREPGETVVI